MAVKLFDHWVGSDRVLTGFVHLAHIKEGETGATASTVEFDQSLRPNEIVQFVRVKTHTPLAGDSLSDASVAVKIGGEDLDQLTPVDSATHTKTPATYEITTNTAITADFATTGCDIADLEEGMVEISLHLTLMPSVTPTEPPVE